VHKKIYYCKSLKHTGKPIVVYDCVTGKSRNTNKIDIVNCHVKMSYNNSTGSIKRSGATTILEVWTND